MFGLGKQQNQRGCAGVILLLGLGLIGWSLLLSVTRSGDTVSPTIFYSFYVGWICGIAFLILGVLGMFVGLIMRVLGAFTGRAKDLGGGVFDNNLPGGLDDFFGGRR